MGKRFVGVSVGASKAPLSSSDWIDFAVPIFVPRGKEIQAYLTGSPTTNAVCWGIKLAGAGGGNARYRGTYAQPLGAPTMGAW